MIRTGPTTSQFGLNGYLLFVASWLLHLPARITPLGLMRFDLLLIAVLAFVAISEAKAERRPGVAPEPRTRTDTLLRVLLLWALLTIPFVEWPGSAVKTGLPNLIKAVVFYYFTVAFVKTEKDLLKFLIVFIGCQAVRVLEPLYLHVTDGYWGSSASMHGGTEFLNRLAGGPFDVVNPNGLAFIICTVLPFLWFMAGLGRRYLIAFALITPLALYALVLTNSRSGMIGFLIVCLGIIYKSKRRFLLLAVLGATLAVGFTFLDADTQDRYLSIFGQGEKNAGTAEDRIDSMKGQLTVVWHKPVVGHGLGTSAEANYHFTTSGPYVGTALPAHNIYLETAQELGIPGLLIFLLFMKSIYDGFHESKKAMRASPNPPILLSRVLDAMQVWLFMNFVFSFASYGLSSYDWYLFGGLSVVLRKLTMQVAAAENAVSAPDLQPAGAARRAARFRKRLARSP